ncbi:MAG: site-specific integrase, partial [Candidatus Odinarchaeota archaeon]
MSLHQDAMYYVDITRFLVSHLAGKSASTRATYTCCLNRFTRFLDSEGLSLFNLTLDDVERFFGIIAVNRARSTVRNYITILNSFFAYLKQQFDGTGLYFPSIRYKPDSSRLHPPVHSRKRFSSDRHGVLKFFLDDQFADVHASDRSYNTYLNSLSCLKQFDAFLTKQKTDLVDISSRTLTDFKSHLQQRKLKSSTVRTRLIQIKSLIKYMFRNQDVLGIELPHWEQVFRVKMPRLVDKLPRPLKQQDIEILLDSSPIQWKAFLYLAYETGSRVSELCSIEMANINWQDKYIRIFTRKTRRERIMPVTARTLDLIIEY